MVKADAFVYDYIRTPRGKGKMGGGLHTVKPVALLGQLLLELQKRNRFEATQIDDIVIGCVSPVDDQGADIARIAALYAGWGEHAPGVQLDRFCGSGFESFNIASMKIRSGWEDLVIAGGVESMSRVPMGSPGGAWNGDPETSFRIQFVPQGICADAIATQDGLTREAVDHFAQLSHRRASAAISAGYFSQTRVPVLDMNGFVVLERDELVRPEASIESLSKLAPAFSALGDLGYDTIVMHRYDLPAIHHVHTAGNSSGIVDGAALLLLGNEDAGKNSVFGHVLV